MSENNTKTKDREFNGPPGMGGGKVEKAKDFKGSWGKLIYYCKGYIPMIIVALIIAAIGTVFQFIAPDRLGDMTNEIMNGLPAIVNGQPILGAIDMSVVTSIAILLVFFYAASAILSFIGSFIMATITARISKSMRTGISEKINKIPFKYYDKASVGDVISRVTNDVDTIGQTLNQSISNLITAITMFFGSIDLLRN